MSKPQKSRPRPPSRGKLEAAAKDAAKKSRKENPRSVKLRNALLKETLDSQANLLYTALNMPANASHAKETHSPPTTLQDLATVFDKL